MYQTPTAAMILGPFIFLIGILGIIALILDLGARIISRVKRRSHQDQEDR